MTNFKWYRFLRGGFWVKVNLNNWHDGLHFDGIVWRKVSESSWFDMQKTQADHGNTESERFISFERYS